MGGNAVEEAFKTMTYGVYIIGTAVGDKINGMTAAWVTRVSVDPPLLLAAISKGHYTSDLIRASKAFSVNLVTTDQAELAAKCGSVSGRVSNKLAEWPRGGVRIRQEVRICSTPCSRAKRARRKTKAFTNRKGRQEQKTHTLLLSL
jgi:hypothetical protein